MHHRQIPSNAPRVWRSVSPGVRVRIVDPTYLAAHQHRQRQYAMLARLRCDSPAEYITARVCFAAGITRADLRGRANPGTFRVKCIIAHWLRRRGYSWQKIATYIGVSDHKTAIHAARSYEKMRGRAISA